jgi:S1-C subfamily serine protease
VTAWTCSFCRRTVPAKVDTCYCGRQRPTTPVEPVRARENSGRKFLAISLAAIATLSGAWWLYRGDGRTQRSAPVRTATTVPTRADRTPVSGAVIDAALASLVMVQTDAGRGSGFFIAPDALITSGRLVPGASRVTVTTRLGTQIGVNVVFRSDERDIALLQVPKESGTFAALAVGNSAAVSAGLGVAAPGWSDETTPGAPWRASIRAVTRDADGGLLQIDAIPAALALGGPLIDKDGRVVGVLTARGSTGSTGSAVPIDEVKPYLAYLRR